MGYLHYLVHTAWLAHEVDRHDGPGLQSDSVLYLGRVDIECLQFYIHEAWGETSGQDCTGRGHEGAGGNNDLISPLCPKLVERGASADAGVSAG